MAEASYIPDRLKDVSRERWPRHIAIIMDGNGRWARRQGMPRIEGHRRGADLVPRMTTEGSNLGLDQLTLYAFSSENWKRPKHEVGFLMEVYRRYLVSQRPMLMENNVRFRTIGRREGIPAKVLAEADRTADLSASNTGMTLCLAVNYGGRQEIVDAARRLAAQVRDGDLLPEAIDEAAVAGALDTAGMPEPDLVIRTAGEMRISNFLLWQISYAELWVTETCWPAFTEADLHEAMADFARRQRRFGDVTDTGSP